MATLKQFRRRLGPDVGKHRVFTSTSGSASTSTVICSALINSDMPAKHYDGGYLLACSGALLGEQKRVASGGFDKTTGTFTTVGAFSGTPATSVEWEYCGRLPAITTDDKDGLRECINRALQSSWIVDRLTFTATSANQRRYAITDFVWWLTDKRRIRRVFEVEDSVTSVARESTRSVELKLDAEVPYLELDRPYNNGDVWQVEVERPANSRLYLSGSWADQTDPNAGLVIDADQAAPGAAINLITIIARHKFYERLANDSASSEDETYQKLADKWAAKASDAKRLLLPRSPAVVRLNPVVPYAPGLGLGIN